MVNWFFVEGTKTLYAKIFSSIFDGSMRGQPDPILVFVHLLCHSNQDGIVDIHWRKIADDTGLSVEKVKAALAVLESPDPESRTPGEEGRRLSRLVTHREWGWRIVNFAVYREMANSQKQREQAADRQRKHRGLQEKIVTERDTPLPPVVAAASASASPKEEGIGEKPETGTYPNPPSALSVEALTTTAQMKLAASWVGPILKAYNLDPMMSPRLSARSIVEGNCLELAIMGITTEQIEYALQWAVHKDSRKSPKSPRAFTDPINFPQWAGMRREQAAEYEEASKKRNR